MDYLLKSGRYTGSGKATALGLGIAPGEFWASIHKLEKLFADKNLSFNIAPVDTEILKVMYSRYSKNQIEDLDTTLKEVFNYSQ